MADVSTESMQQAVQVKVEGPVRTNFVELDDLPAPIRALDRISQNFYWSWQPDGVDLFRELDPDLWIRYEQNPRLLLKNVRELRLWQKAGDAEYVRKVDAFAGKFDRYMSEGFGSAPSVAYFCAEYGVQA